MSDWHHWIKIQGACQQRETKGDSQTDKTKTDLSLLNSAENGKQRLLDYCHFAPDPDWHRWTSMLFTISQSILPDLTRGTERQTDSTSERQKKDMHKEILVLVMLVNLIENDKLTLCTLHVLYVY